MTIHNVTREKFDAAKAELATKAAVTSSADGLMGSISGHGVVAEYTYNSAVNVLFVNVTHKPFFLSQASIEAQIQKEFV